jgi:hypothetical protein
LKCPIEITPAHLVYDRSRMTTDWTCPRRRYWQYEFDGTGVVPEDEAVELFTGSVVHDAMASIARGQQLGTVDIDQIATAASAAMLAYHTKEKLTGSYSIERDATYAKEQAALIYGMLKGFYQHAWPKLMAKYEIVAVEEEMFFVHDQHGKGSLTGSFVMMCKPDLVLRDRITKDLVYLEYKTTSSKTEEWIARWEDAVQVHSTLNAIEQSLGERPVACVVQGLYKGYESYGKQSSPFCYAYMKQGHPPFYKPELSYEYKNGLRRVATWELEGGTKAWVEAMPDAILVDQYPQTPPIFPNDDLITDYFSQRAMRELEIKMAKEMLASADETSAKVVLNGAFPQRFDQCKPYSKNTKPCPNRVMCFGNCTDPIKAGFVKRLAHHQLESDMQNAEQTKTSGS